MTKLKYANIRPLRVEFIHGGDARDVPRVLVTYEGVSETWTWAPPSQLETEPEWTFTQEANTHGEVKPVYGVADPLSREAGLAGAGRDAPSPAQTVP